MAEINSDAEEEILVYAEFEDSIDIQQYRNINVLGINEKSPVIQLDDTFFTGVYEVPLGTYMFFEDDEAPESLDPLFDKVPEKNLKYVCKTRKYIKMEHAYVTEKGGRSATNEVEETNEEVPNIEFKSIQDAIEVFKVIRSQETESAAITDCDNPSSSATS